MSAIEKRTRLGNTWKQSLLLVKKEVKLLKMLFDPHSMQFYDILNLKSNFKFKTGYKDIITIVAYVFKVFIELYS